MTWTFIKEKDWQLRIDSVEQLVNFYFENKVLESDRHHFHRLLKDNGESSYNVVSHSEFGGIVKQFHTEYGLDYDDAYQHLENLQLASMWKVLKETGAIYINRHGGFHGERKNMDMTRFVHRDELKWPLYTTDQIRIKKFDDGTHYYAYIGDTQVRDDNGVLKWDTEEAARAAAEKYRYTRHSK